MRTTRFILSIAGVKKNSIFPYNCEVLSNTPYFSLVLLAENTDIISILENKLKDVENRRVLVN